MLKRRTKTVILLLMVLMFFVTFSTLAFSVDSTGRLKEDKLVQVKPQVIDGQNYRFIEQFYFNKIKGSFVKLDFSDFNNKNKTKMTSLNYYSPLFSSNEIRELGVYYNGLVRKFNVEYSKPSYSEENNSNTPGTRKISIWGPERERIVILKLNEVNGFYWIEYNILYE